jgi:hypothetical protein
MAPYLTERNARRERVLRLERRSRVPAVMEIAGKPRSTLNVATMPLNELELCILRPYWRLPPSTSGPAALGGLTVLRTSMAGGQRRRISTATIDFDWHLRDITEPV